MQQPGLRAAKAAATRQKLLRSARKVFERQGFIDTAVADIVKRARVAHGTFYVHFKDKTDVFKAVIVDAGQVLDHQILTVPDELSNDLVAALRYSNRQYFETVQTLAPLLRAIAEAVNVDDEIRAVRVEQRRGHIDHVAGMIQRWQENGLADPSVDADYTAAALVCMLSEFGVLAFRYGQPYDLDVMTETVTDIWIRSVGLSSSAIQGLGASA